MTGLNFIRRSRSTKLSRSNSLLRSIAVRHIEEGLEERSAIVTDLKDDFDKFVDDNGGETEVIGALIRKNEAQAANSPLSARREYLDAYDDVAVHSVDHSASFAADGRERADLTKHCSARARSRPRTPREGARAPDNGRFRSLVSSRPSPGLIVVPLSVPRPNLERSPAPDEFGSRSRSRFQLRSQSQFLAPLLSSISTYQ
ncbi:hypothetical protein EVAR_22913_1 [Eumeta japonica]|uniref:Uncharacterized protein n=1 Tax=Eumeta variegata TaxID=151549 RepID=A0A4C1UVJ8_EUMVA|nr:hypothetical protein EVAR_22913_1 [Eumeta japonica]